MHTSINSSYESLMFMLPIRFQTERIYGWTRFHYNAVAAATSSAAAAFVCKWNAC